MDHLNEQEVFQHQAHLTELHHSALGPLDLPEHLLNFFETKKDKSKSLLQRKAEKVSFLLI